MASRSATCPRARVCSVRFTKDDHQAIAIASVVEPWLGTDVDGHGPIGGAGSPLPRSFNPVAANGAPLRMLWDSAVNSGLIGSSSEPSQIHGGSKTSA